MRTKIIDEFTDLPISRQRKFQLRMRRDGRCIACGAPVVWGTRCLEHLIKARERQRGKLGQKKRNQNSLSYRLQADPEAFRRDLEQMRSVLKAQAARLKRRKRTE